MTGHDPELLLEHARKGASVPESLNFDRILDLVRESVARYRENSKAMWDAEQARLAKATDHIDRALAVILADLYEFDDDDEFAPFRTEDEAYRWLNGEGPNPDVSDTDWLLDRNSNWLVGSLWKAREELAQRILDIDAWQDADYDAHWSHTPENSSRLPQQVQDLITEACRVWHDCVDDDLKLPRRDPDPDNPLLRFVDACLLLSLGQRRPPKKTLLQFIQRVVRPTFRAEDEEVARDEERARFNRVDLDAEIPF